MKFLTDNVEIILLFIIVAVLFFMFIRVLGKKVGFEKKDNQKVKINLDTLYEKGETLKEVEKNNYPEGSLQYKIHKITELENTFSLKSFIEKSKKAFLLITEKFNSGNIDEIKPLVSENIYTILQNHINNLSDQNKDVLYKFDSFLIADIYDIYIEDESLVSIKVKFVTRQMKKIISKSDYKEDLTHKDLSQYTDIWLFKKNLKDNVSIWKLEKILSE